MNQKAFEKYLATGEYVPTMDADLASHDKHWHPNGFDPKKDHCGLREQMAKNDELDDLIPKNNIEDRNKNKLAHARELGFFGDARKVDEWLSGLGKERAEIWDLLFDLSGSDRESANKMFKTYNDLMESTPTTEAKKKFSNFIFFLADDPRGLKLQRNIEKAWARRDKELSDYYRSDRNTGD